MYLFVLLSASLKRTLTLFEDTKDDDDDDFDDFDDGACEEQRPSPKEGTDIANRVFFLRGGARAGLLVPKQSVSGSDFEAIDRMCVYIIDIVFRGVSLSLLRWGRGH